MLKWDLMKEMIILNRSRAALMWSLVILIPTLLLQADRVLAKCDQPTLTSSKKKSVSKSARPYITLHKNDSNEFLAVRYTDFKFGKNRTLVLDRQPELRYQNRKKSILNDKYIVYISPPEQLCFLMVLTARQHHVNQERLNHQSVQVLYCAIDNRRCSVCWLEPIIMTWKYICIGGWERMIW